MDKIQKIFQQKYLARLIVIILALSFVLIFNGLTRTINHAIKNIFYSIQGERQLDTNIVIIHIDENDIQRLGGWPLKRSYYALLVSELTKLKTAKIGIEVLLSGNAAMQSVYNNLLNEELIKSSNVVLSSLVTDENKIGEKFAQDSIIYSQPKLENPKQPSGHLNYLLRNGILIPSYISVGSAKEYAFAVMLVESKVRLKDDLIKLNFYSSWKKFQNYSLIEFFRMIEENDLELLRLKGKIVLIGVSDPSIAKTISTNFDDELPGVALHAFAADNLLTNRSINYQSSILITLIAVLLLLALSQTKLKLQFYLVMLFSLTAFLVISFILFAIYNIEWNYSALIIPNLLLTAAEIIFLLFENRKKLNDFYSESEILKKALSAKEDLLLKLQHNNNLRALSAPYELTSKIEKLKEEISRLKKMQEAEEPKQISEGTDSAKNFEGIVYKSEVMQNIVSMIQKIAVHNATVLIQGESGSGKELVARAIHNLSKRKEKNFVALNCAALPETLLESELFGHVKGAFTNAIADKKGRFELANGGTIFLDEIGETSKNFQSKLLRIIQFGNFEKVGSSNMQQVDARVIAATNKKLDDLVKQKKFREDLYYRLNVLKIELPALRDRKEDIEPIADYLIQQERDELRFSKAVMESLIRNEWRGNVRELESAIKRAVIFAKAENRNIIKLNDLSEEYRKYDRSNLDDIIIESLRAKEFSHSSINETAKELGDLSRTIVSENLRGFFFKKFVEMGFDLELAIAEIAASKSSEVKERLKLKTKTYLENIKNDLEIVEEKNRDEIRKIFISKYKNLPSKFHPYLDEVIKFLLEMPPGRSFPGK